MTDDTPTAASDSNRRENFRIDTSLPISIRKVSNNVVPGSHIFPVDAVAPNTAPLWEGGINPTFSGLDSTFALMLIEVNAKLDLLLVRQQIQCEGVHDESPATLSMNQLLTQINIKLEYLLGAHNLPRSEERVRIVTASLSAGGIKLPTEENLAPGDLVEVRMLLTIGSAPFWIVVGGKVVRSRALPTGKREVVIRFIEVNEPVQDEITRFALLSQKKQLMARRGQAITG